MGWKDIAKKTLKSAGVNINGDRPWDLTVHNDRLYRRVLEKGTLGFGEAYMDGWWDCKKLDEMVCRIVRSDIVNRVKLSPSFLVLSIYSRIFNMQSLNRSNIVAQKHYDLGNNLFEKMLDKNLQYSCGYWKGAKNLDQAQINKMDLICQKLYLKPGMSVLDVGSGWGGFASYAAKKYGARVTGITLSKEQLAYSKKRYKDSKLRFLLCDYREMIGQFDRIVSIGMIEHVGYKNYRTFMNKMHNLLSDNGLFLLHTIGSNHSVTSSDAWITKYIFPNGMLPSIKQLGKACEKLFVMEDWHGFGTDYDKTLRSWMKNIDKNWPKLAETYDGRFYRMWRYYLLSCAGGFRARSMQLWQIVYSKNGIMNGYRPIR